MRRIGTLLTLMATSALLLWAVVVRGNLDVLGTLTASIVDFTSSSSTAPMKSGTTLPGTCSLGQAFFKTDATAGQNIYLCTAANTWTQVQGGGGGGESSLRPSSRYIVAQTDFGSTLWNQGQPVMLGNFGLTRLMGSVSLNNTSFVQPDVTRSGTAVFLTTSTADDRTYWVLTASNAHQFEADGESYYGRTDLDWEAVYIFRLPVLTAIEALSGLCVASFGNPPTCVGLSYRPASTGSNFRWQTTEEGVWLSDVDTGVPADTAWHRIKIRSDGTQAYKMWMSLDGGTEISVCPSGCTLTRASAQSRYLHSLGFHVRTTDSAQKMLYLDYAHFYVDRGSER